MKSTIPRATIPPPPGRPHWGGEGSFPLIYLGWGRRDFHSQPLPLHSDFGTNYFVLLAGLFEITTPSGVHVVRGPAVSIFDSECIFGLRQPNRSQVEILVWVWRDKPLLEILRPGPGAFLTFDLNRSAINPLRDIHSRCRREVSLSDTDTHGALGGLRSLLEIELKRGISGSVGTSDVRWQLASAWMAKNLSIHNPVPALCDYLGLSRRSLHRFFLAKVGESPGRFFRNLKVAEARRLVGDQAWQVKAAAYHLGYRHPNDLSRLLSATNRADSVKRA